MSGIFVCEVMMIDIKEHIEKIVSLHSKINFPSLLERFVLRNGKVFDKVLSEAEYKKLGIKRRKSKECFKNSTDLALYNDSLTYVEGYAIREDLGLLIQHAWVIDDKENVIDTTWNDPEDCIYMGVPFDREILRKETFDNGYYGLFTGEVMVNVDFLLRVDPGLREFLPDRFKPNTK